jgi:hypothetical protein
MNQYIGNVDVLRKAFYDSCAENVCLDALNMLTGMLTGDSNDCDVPQTVYDGQFENQPINY